MILGSAAVPLLKGWFKKIYLLALPLVSLYNFGRIPHETDFGVFDFISGQVVLTHVDALSLPFAFIFHVVAFVALLYCLNFNNDVEFVSGLVYAGAAIGAVTAGDLFTFYVFWEMLALSATFLILERRTRRAQGAGLRYLLFHFAGGLILLVGIIQYVTATGSTALGPIEMNRPGAWWIFLGVGINCGWPLLHTWLTDAYPEATIGGVIFLSAFTTKTAIYALARFFPGVESLVWIGTAMAAFPIFYAVIENDLRRVLAYSLINQVGFMVVGVGIGTELAINGAVAHAFNDIIFKGLLFMTVGAVMFRTGKVNATDLGGLARSMPWTCVFCIVGAASISAFPGFSGFVSKSMVVSGAAEGHYLLVWFVLIFASAGVFHHAGIKIPFFAFFGHDAGHRVKEAPANMLAAMAGSALLCVLFGCFPESTVYSFMPFPVDYQPYTIDHIAAQLQLLLFSALAFTLMLLAGVYPAEIRSVNLDFDWFYRKGAKISYVVLDKAFNDLNEAADKLVVGGWVGGLKARLQYGLAGLLVPLFAFTWKALGSDSETLTVRKAKAYRRVERLAIPIGLSAVSALVLLVVGLLYVVQVP